MADPSIVGAKYSGSIVRELLNLIPVVLGGLLLVVLSTAPEVRGIKAGRG
jgi:hypothetical protein